MTSYLVTGDLMFSSRFLATAEAVKADAVVVASAEQLQSSTATRPAVQIFVDVASPASNLAELMRVVSAMAPRPPVIAYGPHVMEERLAEARRAGCDEVLSNGQFHNQMEARLRA